MRLFPIFLVLIAIIFSGCSSTIDTTNLTAQQRFDYAKKLYDEEDYLQAITELQAIILQFPGNEVGDDAQFYLAMSRFKRSEYILAAFEFSKLIKNMPASNFVPEAQFMLAECYYQISPSYLLDQKYTKKAVQEFQAFIDFFPTNPKVAEAERKIKELNDKLAHKDFSTAQMYEQLDYYEAAFIYYNNVLDYYHDTKYAPLALYNKIKLLIDKDKKNEALASIDLFLQRYPNHQYAEDLNDLKQSLKKNFSANN